MMTDQDTDAAREAALEQARAIAAIDRATFDHYLDTAPEPTSEGLLNYAAALAITDRAATLPAWERSRVRMVLNALAEPERYAHPDDRAEVIEALSAWLLPRLCACGCGEPITSSRPEARFASATCRVRAHRAGVT